MHPLNAKLVAWLGAGTSRVMLEPADALPDAYYECGCHPDVVSRLWDDLGRELTADCKVILFGAPALVESRSGVALALALGTAYALRVPSEQAQLARSLGCAGTRRWSSGEETNLEVQLGPGWLFGAWLPHEQQWLRSCALSMG
jgi:hypothetical protein